MNKLYQQHLNRLNERYAEILAEQAGALAGLEGVLIHSGSEQYYYADDRGIPFQAWGHFRHWLSVNRPDQVLLIRPGHRPVYFQVVPTDFWYEQTIDNQSWWADCWELVRVDAAEKILLPRESSGRLAFLGENTQFAAALGIASQLINPPALLHHLDYLRAYKSAYELQQLQTANQLAGKGHLAAKEAFLRGASEYQIHLAYLAACEMLEEECPYTNIVALDEKSAILHYQYKRRNSGDTEGRRSQVLLLDAGCRYNGYCSDVTRTSVRAHTDPVFVSLVESMDALQQTLVTTVKPGLAYQALHDSALAGVCRILLLHGILNGEAGTLLEQKLPHLFFPHGVGHLLGIQVHDVGGRQINPAGDQQPPPADSPALRNTRIMEPDMVFTVEPGLYFIPALLEPVRNQSRGKHINWSLVERLLPLGGIRIEDNVAVTGTGVANLTRH